MAPSTWDLQHVMTNHTTPQAPHSHYMPQLDGLRAVAVFAVVWSHWMLGHPWALPVGLPMGHFGVQLFFVLSGFLITGILLRAKPPADASRGPALKQFFIRRALRIFPAYYLLLAMVWLTDFSDARERIVWHATYTTNIYLWLTKAFSPLSHFWSLSVEEQFYLLWPWVVLWTSPRTLLRIAIAMILGTPVFQIVMQSCWPLTEPTVLMPSAADALGAGALLALVENHGEWKQTFRQIQVLACLPIFVILQGEAYLQGIGLAGAAESIRETTMVITFSLVVSLAASGYRGPVGWVLSHPLLTGIGKISYGIYLIHNFMPHLVVWFLNWSSIGVGGYFALHPGWQFLILWVTTLCLAGLSWVCLESPCLQLKERWGTAHPSQKL